MFPPLLELGAADILFVLLPSFPLVPLAGAVLANVRLWKFPSASKVSIKVAYHDIYAYLMLRVDLSSTFQHHFHL